MTESPLFVRRAVEPPRAPVRAEGSHVAAWLASPASTSGGGLALASGGGPASVSVAAGGALDEEHAPSAASAHTHAPLLGAFTLAGGAAAVAWQSPVRCRARPPSCQSA